MRTRSFVFYKGITKYIVSLMFIVYWLLTILYCSPENFIKIKLYKWVDSFGMFFPQQWSFFAPPPTFNNRLYFSYYSKDSVLIRSVEVIAPIIKKKQDEAPFNFNEQLIDYSINSTIITLNDIIVQEKNFFQLKFKDSSELACSEMAKKEIARLSNSLEQVGTLLNYSRIVLRNQGAAIGSSAKYVRIDITQTDIPKFENRRMLIENGKDNKQEGALFNSNLITL